MSITEILATLRDRRLAPNKKFGQNFLHDENLARWIVAAAAIEAQDRVLEIGPGLGALTSYLLDAGACVTALEIDNGLSDYLMEKFSSRSLCVVRGNALKTLPETLDGHRIVLGNLPYNIAIPLMIETLICKENIPRRMVWMVQKELAERVRAVPFTQNYGAASIVFQTFANILATRRVSRHVFYPAPQVESAIIVAESLPLPDFLKPPKERVSYARFVRSAFTNRRKKISHFIKRFPTPPGILAQIEGFSSDMRPQEISVSTWVELYKKLFVFSD